MKTKTKELRFDFHSWLKRYPTIMRWFVSPILHSQCLDHARRFGSLPIEVVGICAFDFTNLLLVQGKVRIMNEAGRLVQDWHCWLEQPDDDTVLDFGEGLAEHGLSMPCPRSEYYHALGVDLNTVSKYEYHAANRMMLKAKGRLSLPFGDANHQRKES